MYRPSETMYLVLYEESTKTGSWGGRPRSFTLRDLRTVNRLLNEVALLDPRERGRR